MPKRKRNARQAPARNAVAQAGGEHEWYRSEEDQQWYQRVREVEDALDDQYQIPAANRFVQWSANPTGPIPDAAGGPEVDALMQEHVELMLNSPDDEPVDKAEEQMRAGLIATEHHNEMGDHAPNDSALRETQTLERHDEIGEDPRFFLDNNNRTRRDKMARRHRVAKVTEGDARKKMAAALAHFAHENPGVDFAVGAAEVRASAAAWCVGIGEDEPSTAPARRSIGPGAARSVKEMAAAESLLALYTSDPTYVRRPSISELSYSGEEESEETGMDVVELLRAVGSDGVHGPQTTEQSSSEEMHDSVMED